MIPKPGSDGFLTRKAALRGLLAAALLLALPGAPPARAGTPVGSLGVTVIDDSGAPLADAVVTLTPDHPGAATGSTPSGPLILDQVDETFVPYVLVVPRGGTVVFRNSDRPRHHIYSVSPAARFEFFLPPGQTVSRRFDQTGLVAVGCNIHDQMVAHLYVTAAPYYALTGKDGLVTLGDLPAGPATLTIWHPRMATGAPPLTRGVTVAAGPGSAPLTITLSGLQADSRPSDSDHH